MRIGLICLAGSLIGGCTAPVPPYGGPDPSYPYAAVSGASYHSTIGSYTSQRPVEPAPWRQQNERVAPQPKSE